MDKEKRRNSSRHKGIKRTTNGNVWSWMASLKQGFKVLQRTWALKTFSTFFVMGVGPCDQFWSQDYKCKSRVLLLDRGPHELVYCRHLALTLPSWPWRLYVLGGVVSYKMGMGRLSHIGFKWIRSKSFCLKPLKFQSLYFTIVGSNILLINLSNIHIMCVYNIHKNVNNDNYSKD